MQVVLEPHDSTWKQRFAVTSIAEVEAATPRLQDAGYQAMGAYGIPGRRYFRKHDRGRRTHGALRPGLVAPMKRLRRKTEAL